RRRPQLRRRQGRDHRGAARRGHPSAPDGNGLRARRHPQHGHAAHGHARQGRLHQRGGDSKKKGLVRQNFETWIALDFNPLDFWRTHPTEFWWAVGAKLEKLEKQNPQNRYAGGMTEAQVEAIYNETYGE